MTESATATAVEEVRQATDPKAKKTASRSTKRKTVKKKEAKTAARTSSKKKKARSTKAKTAKKKTARKGGTRSRTENGLTPNEKKILGVLAKNKKPLTRADLSKKTGINKGWSRVLGASSKGEDPDSLIGRRLVKCEDYEDVRGYCYVITAAGRKAVGK